jgi:hypothetical protein
MKSYDCGTKLIASIDPRHEKSFNIIIGGQCAVNRASPAGLTGSTAMAWAAINK